MVGRAKSATKKCQITREEETRLMAKAVELYQTEQARPQGEKKMGLRKVCVEVQKAHLKNTGRTVTLNHNTLGNYVKGRRTLASFNAAKSWLLPEEAEQVINYIVELGDRGFPISLKRLKEHVDQICRARLGDGFPANGVGKQWAGRFLEKHSDRLDAYRPRKLEAARARAVNPHTNDAWFTLLGNELETGDNGAPISPECLFGTDETGIQTGEGATQERVIGRAGRNVQYQQKDGNRENITVIVTICADGTSLPPAVIFKGKAFQVKWKQNNPAKASLGYSKKGWTDGEIGVQWIKQFDDQTQAKANGRTRLLLVDGHNSHYTLGFLEYAREHNIRVLCYPSHGTHVYQSLDVGVFSILKACWSDERDKWERERGERITKENFLEVYGRAHLRALKSSIITAAFRKTGVWPFNRDVITTEMMAPSKETAYKGSLPLVPPTPVRIVGNLIKRATEPMMESAATDRRIDEITLPEGSDVLSPSVASTLTSLASSSADFLFNPTPIESSSEPPMLPIAAISPVKPRYRGLLEANPETDRERALQIALQEAEIQIAFWKGRVTGLQSATVLQDLYVRRVRSQLAAKEEKRKGKGKKRGRLVGDGLPRLLTGDEFYQKVEEHTRAQEEEELEKEGRREDRESHKKALAAWKEGDEERKKRNKARLAQWKQDVAVWKVEQDLAKAEHRRTRWNKPVCIPPEKALPKPKVVRKVVVDGSDCGEEAIDESGEDSDEEGWEDEY